MTKVKKKNTSWGCWVINPNGNKLQTFIANSPYVISAPNGPAYFPIDRNRFLEVLGVLDKLFLKSTKFTYVHETLAELESDRLPVKIIRNLSPFLYLSHNSLLKQKPNQNKFSNQVNAN